MARTGPSFLALTALLSATILPTAAEGNRLSPSSVAEATERPNLVLIVIDTLRADHLSAYGYPRKTSPHIDRLASEGTLYLQSVSAAPWTLPSHASLFTGLYPSEHGTTSDHQVLDERHRTLAEQLVRAGYATAGFSNNVWLHPGTGLQRGFETFREMWREQPTRSEGISADDPSTDMAGAETTDEVFEWIDNPGRTAGPFFIFINYFEPHLPYRPTRPYDDDFLPENTDPATVRRLRSFYSPREYAYILHSPLSRLSDQELDVLTALYDGEIAYADSIVGRLVDGLRERGLVGDTVVAITSDHGDHLGENHMLDHKFSVYEPLLRVPLVLWGPGFVPAGLRIAEQVQTHDVFDRLLQLAGSDAAGGRPLPLAPGTSRRYTFAELAYPQIFLEVAASKVPGVSTEGVARALRAVRDGRYKLIWASDGRHELYDLVEDPAETHNLVESLPEVRERLLQALAGLGRSGEDPRGRSR